MGGVEGGVEFPEDIGAVDGCEGALGRAIAIYAHAGWLGAVGEGVGALGVCWIKDEGEEEIENINGDGEEHVVSDRNGAVGDSDIEVGASYFSGYGLLLR